MLLFVVRASLSQQTNSAFLLDGYSGWKEFNKSYSLGFEASIGPV